MEKASRKIVSMPVYSINEGHYLGHVKSLVIDAEEKKLIALLVEQRLWGKDEKIVPFTKVQGIGEDVITIDKTLSLERSTNIPRILENLRRPIPVIGIKVMTDRGKTLGKIEEYYINTDNGEIVTLEISGSFFRNRLTLGRKNIITIAEAAIIVATQALSEMDEVETPVTETLAAAKGAATAVVAGTVKVSQKISQGITDSINKYKSLQESQAADENTAEATIVQATPPPSKSAATAHIEVSEATGKSEKTESTAIEELSEEAVPAPLPQEESKSPETPKESEDSENSGNIAESEVPASDDSAVPPTDEKPQP